ncbi:MAG: hypothetical protein HYV02_04365 [Deltaproteobacteria bacterium]|nr:hypothetical protein [Deltaproteobacteria bacterium]
MVPRTGNAAADMMTESMVVAPSLSLRHQLQWWRKVMHMTTGAIGFFLYGHLGWDRSTMIVVTGVAVVMALGLEWWRRNHADVNDRLCRWFACCMREHERWECSSATWYLLSMWGVFLCCPRAVALLTLWFVAFGDTAAGIVGSRWGRHRVTRHVSLEGAAAAFAVCALGGWILAPTLVLDGDVVIRAWFALMGGLIGMMAEGAFHLWDDNLSIPLFSAPLLWGLTTLFA